MFSFKLGWNGVHLLLIFIQNKKRLLLEKVHGIEAKLALEQNMLHNKS